jgi:hypothetical protein
VNGERLPDVFWMSTQRTTRGRRKMVTHGVRGQHTLCGMALKDHEWRVPFEGCDPVPLCKMCSEVEIGYGTSCDLLSFGLTYRQTDHWIKKGWLKPIGGAPGSGSRRIFPPAEVKIAADMAVLVLAGVRPEAAYRAVRNGGQLAPGVRVVVDEVAV